MSEHWAPAALADAARLTEPGFVSWADLWAMPRADSGAIDADDDASIDAVSQPVSFIDSTAIEATAFARGLAEGQRLAARVIAEERTELAKLADAIETLRPEPSAALAGLLAETVQRLVRQIVGEVTIDGDRLAARAAELAAQVADATRPARLRLSPDDRERLADAALPVELVADPTIASGSLVLETEDGWIEDGPAVALEALRLTLERMGVPR